MTARHLTWLLVILASPLLAAPVADGERTAIDLRRTTLVVRDIDDSLAFYRDALGMEVIYDNVIKTPRDADEAAADRVSRLVFLRANDDYVGVLGLLEYRKPSRTPHNQGAEPFSTGSTVMVFNCEDLDEVFLAAKEVVGARVLSKPNEVSYPSYDGTGTIPVLVSVVTDPDGFVVELNQLLGDLK